MEAMLYNYPSNKPYVFIHSGICYIHSAIATPKQFEKSEPEWKGGDGKEGIGSSYHVVGK